MKRDVSPTILRRRLGAELRQLREDKGLNGERVGDLMEWDRTKVYRIESGQQKIRPKELRELLGYLDVTDADMIAQYVDLAQESKKRGWWSAYGPLPKLYDTYVGLETAATTIQAWEPYVVNGLLQTADYALAIITASVPGISGESADRQVNVRLERQERMADVPLWVVIDESVLHRVIGTRQTMRDQLQHLADRSRDPQVTLQVLPFDEGAHAAGRGAITIMTLDDGDVVYADTPAGQIYPEGEHAEACSLAIEHLHAKALSPNKTRNLVNTVADKFKE